MKPDLHDYLSSINTVKCWSVYRSYGSILVLDFGRKVKYVSTRTKEQKYRGEYSLVIQTANWQLKSSEEVIVHGESTLEEIDEKIELVSDKILVGIENTDEKTTFTFQDKINLVVNKDNELDEWDLYLPNNEVITMQKGHNWKLGKSTDGSKL